MTTRLKGSIPNVSWRCISFEDLQYHPCYHSLPPLCLLLRDSKKLKMEEFGERELAYKNFLYLHNIKQHSSAWQLLHSGRITSSSLSSLLGFTENKVASMMKVPAILHGHETFLQSWNILKSKEKNIWNLELESDVKCLNSSCVCMTSSEENFFSIWKNYKEDQSKNYWKKNKNYKQNEAKENEKFLYDYLSPSLSSSSSLSFLSTTSYSKNSNKKRSKSVNQRLNWGTFQESTAILNLLNYLLRVEGGELKEVGLLTLENVINSKNFDIENNFQFIYPSNTFFTSSLNEEKDSLTDALYKTIANEMNSKNLPPLGVSPDGLISLPNGDTQAVEIKTHSPFYELSNGEFEIILADAIAHGTPFTDSSPTSPKGSSIVPWHLPQLQLEMLCSGAKCRSLIYVLYNFDSVSIYEIERNDEYLILLLLLVKHLYTETIKKVPSNKLKPPKENFFSYINNFYYSTPNLFDFLLPSSSVSTSPFASSSTTPSNNYSFTLPSNLTYTSVYSKLLTLSIEMAEGAKLIDRISYNDIQRDSKNNQFFL